MKIIDKGQGKEAGFSFTEVVIVVCGAAILAGLGLPVLDTMLDHYGIAMASQQIAGQLEYARMKAVSSNEPYLVRFTAGTQSFRVEAADATWQSPDYPLPRGITWNNGDAGPAIDFQGGYVMFLPSGNIPAAGDGSAGRIKLINRSGVRVDIVVTQGGRIRVTPPRKSGPAPF
ncbi:MAG: hypothetical protein H6Q05_2596 [Acidobacteria bacterium]|jgi:Tfp pilus assembly protein FimT|nr:hypothetical protein [Acidobacteriota bacterium]